MYIWKYVCLRVQRINGELLVVSYLIFKKVSDRLSAKQTQDFP